MVLVFSGFLDETEETEKLMDFFQVLNWLDLADFFSNVSTAEEFKLTSPWQPTPHLLEFAQSFRSLEEKHDSLNDLPETLTSNWEKKDFILQKTANKLSMTTDFLRIIALIIALITYQLSKKMTKKTNFLWNEEAWTIIETCEIVKIKVSRKYLKMAL